ncbi:hypothetical protein Pst134EB_028371 [Puccinia striiformis f. sp. tritici]|nr:hypothetical protein Pst134EB_028371 [Puccinia striiformis f. sp. tritici]
MEPLHLLFQSFSGAVLGWNPDHDHPRLIREEARLICRSPGQVQPIYMTRQQAQMNLETRCCIWLVSQLIQPRSQKPQRAEIHRVLVYILPNLTLRKNPLKILALKNQAQQEKKSSLKKLQCPQIVQFVMMKQKVKSLQKSVVNAQEDSMEDALIYGYNQVETLGSNSVDVQTVTTIPDFIRLDK